MRRLAFIALTSQFTSREGLMAKLTPIRAIRAKCLDCCCYSFTEVKACEIKRCALWPYRLGKRPSEVDLAVTEQELAKLQKTPSYVAGSEDGVVEAQ